MPEPTRLRQNAENPAQRQIKAERDLHQQIGRTRLSMVVERLTRCFWPLVTIFLITLTLWAFNAAQIVGPAWSLMALLVASLLGGMALLDGFRKFSWPTFEEATDRLDRSLPNRPLAALNDQQAIGSTDAASVAVWTRHLERMAAAARSARAKAPDLRLSGQDPWATRLVALVAIIAAVFFARSPERLGLTELLNQDQRATVVTGPSFEAWANPPAYTGKPTIYFNETTSSELQLPVGTEITIRVYGDAGDFALSETVSGEEQALANVAEGIGSASFLVVQDGAFTLGSGGRNLGQWNVATIPDAPPTIGLAEEVERSVSGAMELTYEATDDYGIVAGEVQISLDMDDLDRRHGLLIDPEPRPDIVLDLPLPLSGDPEQIEETLIEDLSQHPWAGLPVRLKLTAEDAAGQSGTAEGLTTVLPGRRFFDPLAQAVVEQRRDLLWNIENRERVDQMLRVITHAPEDVFTNRTAFLLTRMALRRMGYSAEDGFTPEERDEIAGVLWQVALLIEDGSLSNARERLRRAQERLQEALRDGATDEEIAELMQELREATDDYMRQLAQEAIENGTQQSQAPPQNQMTITQDQIQELMDRIQELAEQGETEQAEALLQQLQELLENLQMQMSQSGQGQQGGEGQQMMQELQDTLRQQQDLADDSFQELQREFQQGRQDQQQQGQQGQQQPGQQGQQGQQPGQQGQQPGQQGQNGAPRNGQGQQQGQGQGGLSAEELAQRQEALRGMLDGLRGRLPGPSTEEGQNARRSLEEAERNMGEARDNLDENNLSGALDRQADAIDALRDGLRGLGEELQQQAQENQGQTGQENGEGLARDNRDPLGRPNASQGSARDDSTKLPGADALERAQELFDEIRRRSSERDRPEQELDYLRRLLDRF